MTQEAIGKFIAQLREEHKMTQKVLGARLGVSDKAINAWEEGHSMPGMDLYEPLCRVLEIQPSELLSAKKLKDSEKIERGEKASAAVLATKSQLRILNILSIVLIIVGILIAIMLPTMMVQFGQKALAMAAGVVVGAMGIVFRVLFGKAMSRLEKE